MTQAQLAAAKSTMYRGAIESMKTKDAPAAMAWYEKNKDSLDKKDQEHVETILKPAVMAQKANAAAEEAWTQYGPRNHHDEVDIYEMEEQVRAALKGDPEAADKAIQGLKTRREGWDESVKSADDTAYMAVAKMMKDNVDPNKIHDSAAYGALPGGDQLKVKEHIEAKINQKEQERKAEQRAQRGERREVDQHNKAMQVMNKQLKEHSDKVAYWRFNQTEWLSTHSEADIERLNLSDDVNDKLHRNMKAAKDPEKLKEQKIDEKTFSALAHEKGYPAYGAGEENKATMGELKKRVDDALEVAQTRKGSPLSRPEKELEMKRQMLLVPVAKWYGNSETPLYKVKPGDKIAPVKSWSDIPSNAREMVKEVFATRGRTFTEKDALHYYQLLIK